MTQLSQADFDWIQKAGRGAKMLGGGSLGVKDTPTTSWFRFGYYGFCAVITLGTKKRVKGIYVFPEFRGQGHGTVMTEELISLCLQDPGCRVLEAFTVNPGWYEDRGWQRVGRNAHGYATVQRRVGVDVSE